MTDTRVFQNENRQAIRAFAVIRQVGESSFICPADDPWLPLKQTIGSFPEDIMFEREQPGWEDVQEREPF